MVIRSLTANDERALMIDSQFPHWEEEINKRERGRGKKPESADAGINDPWDG